MTRALLAALAFVMLLTAPAARAQDSDALTWARANTCELIRAYIARYPNGRYLATARAQLTARNCPAPQATAPADPCVQARADWTAIATSSDLNVLRAFRNTAPAACAVQRAQADARISELQRAASARAPLQPRPSSPPAQTITLPEMVRIPGQNFEVSRHEVTFAQWDACVGAGGCNSYRPSDENWGRGTRPVIHVSWNDAQAYVRWLNQRTGQRYRLLTSGEWETAARAGTAATYPWGDQEPVCDQGARNGANFSPCTDERTRSVGSFQPNSFGLYDMQGNVWEWTEDCIDAPGCENHVLRGGSWYNPAEALRSSFSTPGGTSSRDSSLVGFRVARAL